MLMISNLYISLINLVFSSFAVRMQSWESSGADVFGSDYSRSAHPVHRGVVKDWDQLEVLWRLTLDEVGVTSPESVSVCNMGIEARKKTD